MGVSLTLSPEDRRYLLDIARESIAHGLSHGCALRPDATQAPEALRAPGASFVTLKRRAELRGCIGSLDPQRPLIEDIAHNAWAAAFRDPRFPPLIAPERVGLSIAISVLGLPEPLPCKTRDELLARLRPGTDGLIVIDGRHRATYLPIVWEQLPDSERFVASLFEKAGLAPNHWSETLRFARYTTESFGDPESGR